MDAVYVTRPGDRNPELQFSLRSLFATLAHDRVWIAGYKPNWVVGVEYLPTTQKRSRYENSFANLFEACRTEAVSDEFVLMHDDFFVLESTDCLPLGHRGTVESVLGPMRKGWSVYRKGLQVALDLLREWGYSDPLDYELHIPMVIDKARMLETLDRAKDQPLVAGSVRTLYGNTWGIGGEQMEDVKIKPAHTPIPEGARFVSTADSSFKVGKVGVELRARFSTPSPYER